MSQSEEEYCTASANRIEVKGNRCNNTASIFVVVCSLRVNTVEKPYVLLWRRPRPPVPSLPTNLPTNANADGLW